LAIFIRIKKTARFFIAGFKNNKNIMKGKYITTQIIMACLASEAERKKTAANRLSGINPGKNMESKSDNLAELINEHRPAVHLKVA